MCRRLYIKFNLIGNVHLGVQPQPVVGYTGVHTGVGRATPTHSPGRHTGKDLVTELCTNHRTATVTLHDNEGETDVENITRVTFIYQHHVLRQVHDIKQQFIQVPI